MALRPLRASPRPDQPSPRDEATSGWRTGGAATGYCRAKPANTVGESGRVK